MYMQPNQPIPPENYSGNAFAPAAEALHVEEKAMAPEAAAAPISEATEASADTAPERLHEKPAEPPPEKESVPAARMGGGGILSRIPLLSSFLPPPRHGTGDKGRSLPDWILTGAVVLLLLADEQSDILPLLLLLLLWD